MTTTVDVNYWPWGGVTVCFSEDLMQKLYAGAEITAPGFGLAGLAWPVVTVIGEWLDAELIVAKYMDQGGGMCFFASWVTIATQQFWLVVPSAQPVPVSNQQHVNFIGLTPSKPPDPPERHVYELMYADDSRRWQPTDLTQAARPNTNVYVPPAAPGSSLDGYATPWNRQQHVNFIGALSVREGHVWELLYSRGNWSGNDLTDAATVNSGSSVPPARDDSPLAGYATAWNSQQHVNYIALDGHVHQLWYSDPSNWLDADITHQAGAEDPAPWSRLAGFATPWNNQQHVFYIGYDGHVYELMYSDPGPWKLTDVMVAVFQNTGINPPPAARPSLFGDFTGSSLDGYVTGFDFGLGGWFNAQQHVDYIDGSGHVNELWYSDSGGWQSNDLMVAVFQNTGIMPLPAAPGSPLDGYQTVFNLQQHVNYVDAAGHVHELWYSNSGGWQPNDLINAASDNIGGYVQATLPGRPLDGYQTVFNDQQHVNYLGYDKHVHELMYSDSGGWQPADLTHQATVNSHHEVPPATDDSPLDGYPTSQ